MFYFILQYSTNHIYTATLNYFSPNAAMFNSRLPTLSVPNINHTAMSNSSLPTLPVPNINHTAMSNSSLPTLPVPNISLTQTIDQYSDIFSLSVNLCFWFSHFNSIYYKRQTNYLASYNYYYYCSSTLYN